MRMRSKLLLVAVVLIASPVLAQAQTQSTSLTPDQMQALQDTAQCFERHYSDYVYAHPGMNLSPMPTQETLMNYSYRFLSNTNWDEGQACLLFLQFYIGFSHTLSGQ